MRIKVTPPRSQNASCRSAPGPHIPAAATGFPGHSTSYLCLPLSSLTCFPLHPRLRQHLRLPSAFSKASLPPSLPCDCWATMSLMPQFKRHSSLPSPHRDPPASAATSQLDEYIHDLNVKGNNFGRGRGPTGGGRETRKVIGYVNTIKAQFIYMEENKNVIIKPISVYN